MDNPTSKTVMYMIRRVLASDRITSIAYISVKAILGLRSSYVVHEAR